MDRLTERLHIANRALTSFEAVVGLAARDPIGRDSALMRFTYTIDTVCKAGAGVLAEKEQLIAGSPRAAVRFCRDAGLLTDDQTKNLISMIEDRNRVAHAYHEGVAADIATRLTKHASLLRLWLTILEDRASRP